MRPIPTRFLDWLFAILLAMLMPAAAISQAQRALVVDDILKESAAAKAGFRLGDRVWSYDARTLLSPAALQAAEENTAGKEEVILQIQRGGETLMLTVPAGKLGIQVRPELAPAALSLYEEGRAAQQAQKLDVVITRWTAAIKAAQESGDTESAAWLYGRVGEIHENQRHWKEAGEAQAAAWELLKQGSDRSAQSRILMALGRCNQNLNNFLAAQQWYEQAAQVDRIAGNELWVAGDLNDLGNLARARGDLPAAQDYFSRSLRIRERLAPESLDVSVSLNNLGATVKDRGDLIAAEDYLRRALRIRERLSPDSLDVAGSLNNLGNVANDRGDLAMAQDYYSRALAIQERRAPDSLVVASSLNNLGIIGIVRGDLTAAHDYYSRALRIRQRLAPNSLEVAASLNNLGNVASEQGDLVAAQDYHTRALAIKEPLAPDSLTVAASLNNLANVVRARGDLEAAHSYNIRARDIREKLAPDSVTLATTLNNLGNIAHSRGDFVAAQDYHIRALSIRERLSPNSLNVGESLQNLGGIANSRHDLTAAQDYFSRALAIKERLAPNSLNVATSLNSLGVVGWARDDAAAAQDYHNRALRIRERLAPGSLQVAESLNNLAGIALKQRRFSDALPMLTRAVDIVEAQRWKIQSTEARALLLAQHTESYTGLLRAHVALNNLPAAFATAERARARSLLEILNEARAGIRQGVDPQLLQRERLLQQQLNAKADRQTQLLSGRHTDEQAAAGRNELDALLLQYQELQAQIRRQSPRYAALTQPQPLGLQEIQRQLLDENTLLLEYVLGEESSFLFAVTRDSIRHFELPKRAEIEQSTRRVIELLRTRQPVRGETPRQRQARINKADAEFPAAAAALSRMVLEPVSGLLSSQRLLIVADGALQMAPFGALPAPGQGAAPLVVHHEIVNLPSASVVAAQRQELQGRRRPVREVAVLADPVFDVGDPRLKRSRQSPAAQPAASLPNEVERVVRSAGLLDDRGALSRLPFTREEADAILAVAHPGQSTKAVDFKASRATLSSTELGDYRIVHLATHGLLDMEHPELSGIVLSLVDERGKPQDGFLRLHEVYNLNWSADLVVLSACQTGLGKEIRGEGLVGLTRGFMYAGAKGVLASLWNVNDSVTAQLMKQFYQGLFVKGLPPAAALRAAQIEMSKRKPSSAPYYWAAFVLQGDWR